MLVSEVAGFHLGSPRSDLVHHLLLEMTTSLSAAWHGQAGPGTWLPSVPMKDLSGHQHPVRGFGITELRGLTAQVHSWCFVRGVVRGAYRSQRSLPIYNKPQSVHGET